MIHFFCFITPFLGAKYEFRYIEIGLLTAILIGYSKEFPTWHIS